MMRVRRRLKTPGEVNTLDDLTADQVIELCIGPAGASEFSSEEEREAEYFRHRTILRARVNLTTRPWAWWRYESPDGQPPTWPASDGDRLEELGELNDDELDLLAEMRALHGRRQWKD